jgi:hypothetical protein
MNFEFQEMDKSHFYYTAMTGSISDFWLKILPKNLALELRWNKFFRQEAARLEESVLVEENFMLLVDWL